MEVVTLLLTFAPSVVEQHHPVISCARPVHSIAGPTEAWIVCNETAPVTSALPQALCEGYFSYDSAMTAWRLNAER